MAMGIVPMLAAAVLLLAGSAAGQTLAVNATIFLNNDAVSIVLSGVASPSINDSVALFLASAADPDTLRPIKCVHVANTAPRTHAVVACPTYGPSADA